RCHQRTQVQTKVYPRHSKPEKQHPKHSAPTAPDTSRRQQDVPRIRRIRRPELQNSQRRNRHRPSPSNGRAERGRLNLRIPLKARLLQFHRPSARDPDTRSRPKPHSIFSKPAEGPGHGPSCTRNIGGFVACLEASRKRSTQFLSRSEWIRLSIGSQPRKKNWSTCRQGSSSETKRCSSAA